MRALELAKVAAAAEALRVKRFARRQAVRATFAAIAALFALAFFAMLHVLAVTLLMMAAQPWLAILIVLAADLVIAGLFGAIALRNQPDRVEREAAEVRRQSLTEARRAAVSLATVGELAGFAIASRGRKQAKATQLGKIWMLADLASRFVRR